MLQNPTLVLLSVGFRGSLRRWDETASLAVWLWLVYPIRNLVGAVQILLVLPGVSCTDKLSTSFLPLYKMLTHLSGHTWRFRSIHLATVFSWTSWWVVRELEMTCTVYWWHGWFWAVYLLSEPFDWELKRDCFRVEECFGWFPSGVPRSGLQVKNSVADESKYWILARAFG